jgi:hypothetical protein
METDLHAESYNFIGDEFAGLLAITPRHIYIMKVQFTRLVTRLK